MTCQRAVTGHVTGYVRRHRFHALTPTRNKPSFTPRPSQGPEESASYMPKASTSASTPPALRRAPAPARLQRRTEHQRQHASSAAQSISASTPPAPHRAPAPARLQHCAEHQWRQHASSAAQSTSASTPPAPRRAPEAPARLHRRAEHQRRQHASSAWYSGGHSETVSCSHLSHSLLHPTFLHHPVGSLLPHTITERLPQPTYILHQLTSPAPQPTHTPFFRTPPS
jgi:hypothetical protein